eukprot:maker-scaffold13_size735724-snap-gene-2.20 protein:Tk03459 transcript:maker-scaffold13_size735724-snap-gene-2.20-mRNA-1 annotation:"PREDICTED: putative uncharacterized protein FLJ37770-like"
MDAEKHDVILRLREIRESESDKIGVTIQRRRESLGGRKTPTWNPMDKQEAPTFIFNKSNTLNQIAIKSVAIKAWKAFQSTDGGSGERNPIGKVVFPFSRDAGWPEHATTRSKAAGLVPPPLRMTANTFAIHASKIFGGQSFCFDLGSRTCAKFKMTSVHDFAVDLAKAGKTAKEINELLDQVYPDTALKLRAIYHIIER